MLRRPGRDPRRLLLSDAEGPIEAQARLIRQTLDKAEGRPVRVLFSAHGTGKKLVAAGDPYQAQVEAMVAAVCRLRVWTGLGHLLSEPGRTAEMAGAGHAGRHRTGGQGRRGRCRRAHRLRLRSISRPLVELDMNTASWRRSVARSTWRATVSADPSSSPPWPMRSDGRWRRRGPRSVAPQGDHVPT